jgi:hypothetical protein
VQLEVPQLVRDRKSVTTWFCGLIDPDDAVLARPNEASRRACHGFLCDEHTSEKTYVLDPDVIGPCYGQLPEYLSGPNPGIAFEI